MLFASAYFTFAKRRLGFLGVSPEVPMLTVSHTIEHVHSGVVRGLFDSLLPRQC